MNLDGLLFNLNYPEEVERAVRDKIFRDEKQIKQIAQTAYRGDNFDFLLCKRMPLTRLAVVTWLLMEKYLLYQAKGISDEMIFETFRDVALRAGLYYQKTGKPGISRDDVVWFRHIMNAEIFKIGALQYQPFEMLYLDEETIGEPYMVFSEEQKTGLPAGSPVINCHIQRGADLRAAGKSLDMARTFFAEYFPDVHYRAFLCYSWLLYPPMVERLSEKSNIRHFAKYFSVIGACADDEQAMENLWNPSTALGKLAKEERSAFGFACGIIPITP